MARNKKNQQTSEETKNEAIQIARATQRPGQTKEQTKLIAMGIQKGIDQYKKQHKAKLREIDKRRKKAQRSTQADNESVKQPDTISNEQQQTNKLPWVLLALSWLLFATYLVASWIY
jgi:hypothetical protein